MAYSIGDISSLINVGEKKPAKRKRKENLHDKDAVVDDSADEKLKNFSISELVEDVTDKIVVKKKPKLEKNVDVEPQRNRAAERKEAEDRTIFVGNAPISSKRREIQKLFSRFGPIEAVYQRSLLQKNEKLTLRMLGTDKKIEKNLTSTNFFVRFKSPDDAKTSVELNGFVLDNHTLRVTFGNKKEFDSKHTVFIGNLPFDVTENQIHDYFSVAGKIDGIRVIHDKVTGRGRGIAYVAFEERASVLLALNHNDEEFSGRSIRVSKVLKKNKRPMAGETAKAVKGKKKRERKKQQLMGKISEFATLRNTKDETSSSGKKLTKKTRKAIKKRVKSKTKKSLMS